jgi:hypothetical protein
MAKQLIPICFGLNMLDASLGSKRTTKVAASAATSIYSLKFIRQAPTFGPACNINQSNRQEEINCSTATAESRLQLVSKAVRPMTRAISRRMYLSCRMQ